MADGDPSPAAPSGPAGPAPEQAGILIVDDRRSNLVALEALIEPLGRPVRLAESGEEALRILLSERFALILLDVQMPRMDGFELARYIRDRPSTRRTPIIFVTAVSTASQHIFDGYQAGAVDYLLKPVDPVILRSKVAVFIELFESAQRLQRQAELQGAHESLRLAQRAGSSGVWDWDVKADSLYVSPEYRELVGIGSETSSVDDIIMSRLDPRDQERVASRLRAFVAGGGDVWDEEFRIVHPRRGVRWLATRGRLARDERGAPERFTGIAIDITDRHAAEDRLQRLHAATVALSAAATPAEVAAVVVEHGRRATGATAAWLTAAGEGDGPSAASPGWAPAPADLESARRAIAGEGPAVWASPDGMRLATPLTAGDGSRVGALGLVLEGDGALDDDERGFLAAFASQCGQALERARLYEAERESRRRTEALQAATAALAVAVTRREVGEAVVREALRAFDAASASMRLIDPEAGALETVAVAGFPDGLGRPLGSASLDARSPTTDAVRSRRPLYLACAADVEAAFPGADPPVGWPPRDALAAVPLHAGDRAIGALALRFGGSRAFPPADREALEAFAGLAAQAAVRASLHEAEQRRTEAAGLQADASLALDADMAVAERLRRLAALLVPGLGDACCIELVQDDGSIEVAAVAGRTAELEALVRLLRERYPLGADEGDGARWAMERGESLLVPEITGEHVDRLVASAGVDAGTAERLRRARMRSGLMAPISARGGSIGAIMLISCDPGRRYDTQDLHLLEDIGARAGLALDNARLYEAQLGVARTLQQSLLPPGLPLLRDLGLAARYLSAAVHTQASGDWYDAVVLPGGRLFLGVGDVVGQGTAAAAVMGQLRSALRAYALAGQGPAATLEHLSDFAAGIPGAEVSTAAAAEVDPARGRLTYACAGHLPPLLVDAAGDAAVLEEGRGPALGVGRGGYHEATVAFAEGSTLVLYTDGLVERRGERLDDGLERLRAAAAGAQPAGAAELCDLLVEALVDPGSVADDVAVLVCRHEAPVEALTRAFTASPGELAAVRQGVREWLVGAGVDPAAHQDVVLACGEALANAVEHAYLDLPPGPVELELSLGEDRTLVARVRDEGRWRPPRPDGGLRGRGLVLMRKLMSRTDVRHDAAGTEVVMTLRPGTGDLPHDGVPPPPQPVPGVLEFEPGANGALVGRVLGEVDASRVPLLREQMERAAGADGELALDLDGVHYIDSSGLRLLAELGAELAAGGGRLRLRAAPGSPPHRIIRLVGLDTAPGVIIDDA